jgi:O-antigen/teichoic acid export membrane protein
MNLKKNTFQLAVANGILLVNSLFQTMVFSRLMGDKTVFGELQQVTLVSGLLVAALVSLPNAVSYFSGSSHHETQTAGALIRRFAFVSALMALLVSLLLLLCSGPLGALFTNRLVVQHRYAVSLLVFLRLLNTLYPNICLVTGRLRRLIAVNLLQCGFLLLLFLLRDAAGYVSVPLLLGMLVAAELAESMALLVGAGPYFIGRAFRGGRLNLSRPEWKYVSYLLLNGAVIALTGQVDRLIISSCSNPAVYSDYSLGSFANPVIGVLLASLTTAFIPVLSGLAAKKDTAAIFSSWKKVSAHAAVFIIPLVSFTIFFGSDIILFLFTGRYKASGILFQLYNCRYLLVFMVFSATMNAVGLEKYTLINSVINLFNTAFWVFAGLRLYGAMGAVAGSIVAIYLGYIYPVYIIRKKLGGRVADYFPLKTFALCCTICALGGGLFGLLRYMLAPEPAIVVLLMAPLYYGLSLLAIDRWVFPIINTRFFSRKMFI